MRPEERIIYEAEVNPINGRKEILAYALGGGKVRNRAPAGEWVSAFPIRVISLSTFVWLQSHGLFYSCPWQSPAR